MFLKITCLIHDLKTQIFGNIMNAHKYVYNCLH